MGAWAAGRSSSPAPARLSIERPTVVTTEEASLDARVKALEQQRDADHGYFCEILAALHVVDDAVTQERSKRINAEAEVVRMDMLLRADVAAQKEQILENVLPKMDEFFRQGPGVKLLERIDDAHTALAKLAFDISQLRVHELKVEDYLKGLHQDRPREGQAIQELVANEVGQVRELVKHFEASVQVPRIDLATVPFTQAMKQTMGQIEDRVRQMDGLIGGYNLLADQVNHDHGRIEAIEYKVANIFTAGPPHHAPGSGGLGLVGAYSGGCCSGPPQWSPPEIPSGNGSGSSGDGEGGGGGGGGGGQLGAVIRAVIGGNSVCHCIHVNELTDKVLAIER